uniref:GIY-YIG domain-containing protein n=1 Tax=Panagrolaimus sp. JU765 TaxID=591449 RepID=A0AC34RD58_9BILA
MTPLFGSGLLKSTHFSQIHRRFFTVCCHEWKPLLHKSGRKFHVLNSDIQKSGIYEMQAAGKLLYFGQTKNLLKIRLRNHLSKPNRLLKIFLDDGIIPEVRIVYEFYGNKKTLGLCEKKLIQRNRTLCNVKNNKSKKKSNKKSSRKKLI